MKLLKLIGLIFLVCVFFSLGRRASEVSPPAPQPWLEQGPPADTWTLSVDPPICRFPEGAFNGHYDSAPSQIQTQQQTVNVYPSVPNYYDGFNYMLTSPSYGLYLRTQGTQRPSPIRRDRR